MNIEDIDCLLSKIRDASGLDEFVVIGSLSALGLSAQGLPSRMTWSMEVDGEDRDWIRAGIEAGILSFPPSNTACVKRSSSTMPSIARPRLRCWKTRFGSSRCAALPPDSHQGCCPLVLTTSSSKTPHKPPPAPAQTRCWPSSPPDSAAPHPSACAACHRAWWHQTQSLPCNPPPAARFAPAP